jgi:hypothetical protein
MKLTDLWFWILSVYGVFFLPVSLLRGIMLDTFDALNAIEIVRSISRVFVSYCGLVLFFVVVGGLIGVAMPKVLIWNFPKKGCLILSYLRSGALNELVLPVVSGQD